MSIKLDRQDLRALLAMQLVASGRCVNRPKYTDPVMEADDLLAEIDRTAPQAEPAEPMSAEWLADKIGALGDYGQGAAQKLRELAAQVKELEAWKESALEVMNGISFQEVGKALGVPLGKAVGPEILTGIRWIRAQLAEAKAEVERLKPGQMEHDTAITFPLHDIINELQDRLAAIDAAKAGEQPCPVSKQEQLVYIDGYRDRIIAWGRQGHDAAAALRVELEQVKASIPEMCKIRVQVARTETEKAERERCANVLAEWVEYRMADGDAVRILDFLTPGEPTND